jgi:hypothetical protein
MDSMTMRVELKRIKLTDRFVKSATTGGRKSPIFMDDEVIGFGVQVRENGRRLMTGGVRAKAAFAIVLVSIGAREGRRGAGELNRVTADAEHDRDGRGHRLGRSRPHRDRAGRRLWQQRLPEMQEPSAGLARSRAREHDPVSTNPRVRTRGAVQRNEEILLDDEMGH